MKALITKASDSDYEEVKEFDSFEAFLKFVGKTPWGAVIVESKNTSFVQWRIETWEKHQGTPLDIDCEVMIYDDYIE